jgi:nicotinate-nucleotide adenylyltransferase
MNVALFGGSFDPPHLGHLQVAESLLHQRLSDQVWFVPAKQHPFAKALSPEKERLAMLELTVAASSLQNQLRIEKYELSQDQPSYSYQTLVALRQKYPQHQLSWVIGSDNLAQFHRWYRYQDLLDEFTVYVYPRKNSPMTHILKGMQPLTDVPEINISSQKIRQNLELQLSIAGLVVPAVEEYLYNKAQYDASSRSATIGN